MDNDNSPFNSLPSHKNEGDLSGGFIQNWVAPYYMAIARYGDSEWIDSIKQIKDEITEEVVLLLLGDFNWRPRLVGSYFSAVKDYTDFIDIIGTHLLKSELCCVGHIYALTLAFFNSEKSVEYLNKYLQYYLTKPSLYFDQKWCMEALLYLDSINNTDNFNQHINIWKLFQEERTKLEEKRAIETRKKTKELEERNNIDAYLKSLKVERDTKEFFKADYFDKQIEILKYLKS